MDRKLMDTAADVFLKNDYHRKQYEKAPSDLCRERMALTWYFSIFGTSEEWFARREEVEHELSLDDWKYLASIAPNNPWKGKCRSKIRELGGTTD